MGEIKSLYNSYMFINFFSALKNMLVCNDRNDELELYEYT